ncbi:MAG TPA: Zn-dependent alcohol dehydrogenase [Candidatus Dormibacteraeota bacterium]|jgi:S-(hydroxymethyl)glutathione dehydrogenase/alcohol dehydrogenase|nr:Zn-dependent alcohol dehydrogenase [Candidatus Dormibacteraeota bacterium]
MSTEGTRVRAAVMRAVGAPMEITDLHLDPPRAGEVQVRLHAAGVCHSDLSILEGRIGSPLPVVLGHEGAGVVEAVGEGVRSVAPGDHVVLSWVPMCGHCFFCLHGQPQLCTSAAYTPGLMDDGTTRLHDASGAAVHHGLHAATFAERTVVREGSVVRVDADVPFAVAAVVGCAVTTGVGAALRTAEVRAGERVAVIGCGGVGLSVIQGCRLAGAERIIAIDTVESRLEAAQHFGATDVVRGGDRAASEVRALTGKLGVDVAFEVAGVPRLQRQAWDMARRGGRAIMVGVPGQEGETSFPSLLLAVSEKTLKGCYYGSAHPPRDFPWLLSLYRAGRLDLDSLVTQRLPLDGVDDAFEAMRRGEQLRTVLEL